MIPEVRLREDSELEVVLEGGGFQDTKVTKVGVELDPPFDHAACGWLFIFGTGLWDFVKCECRYFEYFYFLLKSLHECGLAMFFGLVSRFIPEFFI